MAAIFPQGLGLSWLPNRAEEPFPDPFADYASTVMPDGINEAHRWSMYIASANGLYASALQNVLSFFITEVEPVGEDIDDGVKAKYLDWLNDDFQIDRQARAFGFDFLVSGNGMASFLVPFRRALACPGCGDEHPFRIVTDNPVFGYQWRNYEPHARCPSCGFQGRWLRRDRKDPDPKRVGLRRWNPIEMDILFKRYHWTRDYIWKINEIDRRNIRVGYPDHVEDMPWDVVDAVRLNANLRLNKDYLFHLFEEPLAGTLYEGWGVSRVLANFRQAWYYQVLHRYNEAIAMDYVIPFRVITPSPEPGAADAEAGDPLLNLDLGSFMARVQQMLRIRRRDPAAWHTLPMPIQYQALGGEAKNLAPFELLDQAASMLLNNIGVPVELYKGTLQLQTAPAAIRLFQSKWSDLYKGLSRFVNWVGKQAARHFGWPQIRLRYQPPSLADDLEATLQKLQLMTTRQISQTSGLRSIGADFREEQRKIIDEERYVAELQARFQEEMDQAAQQQALGQPQQGQPGQQGDPSQQGGQGADQAQQQGGAAGQAAQSITSMLPSGPNVKVSPTEQLQNAQNIAQELMSRPPAQRVSELRQLKQKDPTMHMIVTGVLRDMRSQAASAGKDQVLAQQFGGGQQQQ